MVFRVVVILSVFSSLEFFAQTVNEFHGKTYVKYNSESNQYEDNKGWPLQKIVHKSVKSNPREYIGIVNTDSIILKKPSTEYQVSLDAVGFNSPKRLYGDVRQSNDTIYFFPWPLNKSNRNYVNFLSKMKNKSETAFKETFAICIPDRKVASLRFRTWQFGALTLPAKVYLSDKKSGYDNTTFDVNLNVMVGHKWGVNRYYHLPNDANGQSYPIAFSVNAFLGVTKLQIDSTNTTDSFNETHILAALGTGLAFGYHYRKVGIFLALGVDLPTGPRSNRWVFYSQPWLGFGLGLGLSQ